MSVFILVLTNPVLFVSINSVDPDQLASDEAYIMFFFYSGSFAFIVLRMSCYCKCSVALPHGATIWSPVCVFGFS